MRAFKLILTGFILLLIQTSLSRYISVLGVVPNLILLFVICMAVLDDSFARIAAGGIIAGAAAGALGVNGFYYSTIVFTWTAMIIYLLPRRTARQSVFFAEGAAVIITVIFESVYFAVNYKTLGTFGILSNIKSIIIPEVIYNAVVMLGIYPLMKFFVCKSDSGSKLKLNG